jgi:hypothetical protein
MDLTFSSLVGELRALLPQVETDTTINDAAERAVDTAINSYSRLRPNVEVADLEGDGSTQSFSMPSDYQYPFSNVLSIEYPYGEIPPVELGPEYYSIYMDTDGEKIVFHNAIASGESARVKYTCLHSISDDETTIPSADWAAFLYLSAYHLANYAVGYYGSTTRATLSADVVNYRTKSDEWRSIAEHFYRSFQGAMGMKVGDTVRSGLVVASLKRDGLIWRR